MKSCPRCNLPIGDSEAQQLLRDEASKVIILYEKMDKLIEIK